MTRAFPSTLEKAQIPAIRAQLGLTQGQMAERIGISRRYLADLEIGTAVLSPVVANAIRWIEHIGGAFPADVCQPCEGRGMARGPVDPLHPKRLPPRLRCLACDGEGVVRLQKQEAA